MERGVSDAPTDPQGRTPRKGGVGDLSLGAAGALEAARGLGTAGAVALVLYQALSGQLDDVRDELRGVTGEVATMRAEIGTMRVEIARLEERMERQPQRQPSP